MTLLKDNNYKEINVALLSLEADIKNKITGFDTSAIDKQLAEINSRIDKINAGGGSNSSEEIEDINSKLNSNSNKITNLEQNIGDIDTRIDGIEQKLSDIFSAENKVTDFNATTNSGIYYWIEDAANRPGNYGVLLVNKYDSGSGSIWINQIAYDTTNKIHFRQNINSGNWTEWKAVAFEGEEKTTTKSVSLSTVTTGTTKYIKLGTFHWNDSFSFRCRIAGNSFEDNVNINILSGNTNDSSVCGYYSTNAMLTKSIIVKRGGAWNSDFEIYLKIVQLTTANVYVTIDKAVQDRINISESTTAPSGTLEEIVFSDINGMFSSSVNAKNLTLRNGNIVYLDTFGNEPLSIGTPSSLNLGIDRNSIQARNNGAADVLYLNYYGGGVQIGAGNVTGSKLTIQGRCVSSNSYTDANPKLEFKDEDGSQNISLTFNDFDAVQAPASLTLNGNQGNEYFIAPNIKANRNITLDSASGASLATYGTEPLTIGFPSGTGGGASLGFDRNSIQARTNGEASIMYINFYGGMVHVNEQNISNGGLKVKQKMVIPIGAPSSLEDGCIWIER